MDRFTWLIVLLMLLFGCGPDRAAQERELLSRLQRSSDLATTEMVFSKVIKGTKTTRLLGFTTGTSDFLAEAEARAKAGVDLSQVQVEAIDWEQQSIRLRLPPPKIISFSIPAESIRINEEYTRNHYFSELEAEDMDQFMKQAEVEMRAALNNQDLIGQTREKTERFLREFLAKAGFSDISLTFAEAPATGDR